MPNLPGRFTERLLALAAFCTASGVAYLLYGEAERWKVKYNQLLATATQVEAGARREADALRARAEEDCDGIRKQATDDMDKARAMLANAEIARQEKLSNVKSAAELIRDQELHTVFPDLQPIDARTFTVKQKYVEEFTVPNSTRPFGRDDKPSWDVSITYQNDGKESVSPNIWIYFYNESGVATATVCDVWHFDSIGRGERRINKVTAVFEHGPAVYWRIEIR